MSIPNHIHISEREADGSWEDCTWDSGLEWYRDCFDPHKPATHTEAQALRKASGEPATGGSNLGNLRDGIKARYGKSIPAAISNKVVLAHLAPGWAAVLQGSMAAFGSTHRLSVWDRSFDGGHAVYLANYGGKLWWCDPEAPTSASVPVVVSAAEVTAYVNAFNGQAIVAPLVPAPVITGAPVELKSYLPGYTAKVKAGSNIRLTPRISGTLAHATTADVPAGGVIGTVLGDVDPANGSNVWYALWHESRVEYTAKDNIIGLTAPVPLVTTTGITQAQMDAAVDAAVSFANAAGDAKAVLAAETQLNADRAKLAKLL